MRRVTLIVTMILAFAGVGIMSFAPATAGVMIGCVGGGQTPLQTYSLANDTFINAQARVATLRQAGRISTEDYNKVVLPLMRETDALITEWDAALKSGTKPTIDYATLLQAALSRITAYLVAQEAKH